MQKVDNEILFSATDLIHFLECEHHTHLDLIDLQDPLPRTEDDDGALILQARGFEHESIYLHRLSDVGMSIKDLSKVGGSPYTKANATREAMITGADIIFQGTLLSANFVGHPDFLRRVNSPSGVDMFSYEVLDTKLARNPKSSFIIQLCFYSELLAELQGLRPRFMHLVLGDGSELNFRFDQYREYYHALKDRFLDQITHDGIDNSYPEMCDHCSLCHWRELCEAKWLADDHLNQVANITRIQIKKLRGAGIHTLTQLAQQRSRIRSRRRIQIR
jgi:predicted RecB family nuclease